MEDYLARWREVSILFSFLRQMESSHKQKFEASRRP